MQYFEEEDIKQGLSQERLEQAKEFFLLRLNSNQEQLDRVNVEFLTANDEKKKFLVKSKAGYEGKIASCQNIINKINGFLGV